MIVFYKNCNLVKKSGAGSTSIKSEMRSYVQRDRDLLLEQIDIIFPDVIVGGLSWNILWQDLFGVENMKNWKDWRFYFNGIKVFNKP